MTTLPQALKLQKVLMENKYLKEVNEKAISKCLLLQRQLDAFELMHIQEVDELTERSILKLEEYAELSLKYERAVQMLRKIKDIFEPVIHSGTEEDSDLLDNQPVEGSEKENAPVQPAQLQLATEKEIAPVQLESVQRPRKRKVLSPINNNMESFVYDTPPKKKLKMIKDTSQLLSLPFSDDDDPTDNE